MDWQLKLLAFYTSILFFLFVFIAATEGSRPEKENRMLLWWATLWPFSSVILFLLLVWNTSVRSMRWFLDCFKRPQKPLPPSPLPPYTKRR